MIANLKLHGGLCLGELGFCGIGAGLLGVTLSCQCIMFGDWDRYFTAKCSHFSPASGATASRKARMSA
jgi:hypothetical protein